MDTDLQPIAGLLDFGDEPQSKRAFKIIKGSIPVPEEPAEEPQGNPEHWWEPQHFDELDTEIGYRSMLARHHRQIAEQRLADAKRYEAQIDKLLWKFHHLVPAPIEGKAWRETLGEFSGGKYRHQPNRAPQYRLEDKEQAKAAGLTATYEALKVDLQAVKSYESGNPSKPIPGIRRTDPCAVSFKPIDG